MSSANETWDLSGTEIDLVIKESRNANTLILFNWLIKLNQMKINELI